MKAQEFVAGTGHVIDLKGLAENLFVEMRPQEWLKNLFVLAPLFLSQQMFVPGAAGRALVAFVSFCLMSSSVYLLNDLADYKQDRLHPVKCRRPLAAGKLDWGVALEASLALFLFSIAGGVMLGQFALILIVYWLINLLYSAELKHRFILDVFAATSGLVLRVVGGAIAIQAHIDPWLLIGTTCLALLLVFSKRRHELVLFG